MDKVALGPTPLLYPMPAMLIGATVGRKANFMTASWGGIACQTPPMLTLALRASRHTFAGIMETRVFTVNIPRADMARETDLCGIVSGTEVDKAALCNFTVVYGKLGNAPMIAECPLSLECSVHQILELGTHSLILGLIEETHVAADCLVDGKPDAEKVDPLVYLTGADKHYARLGDTVARAYKAGLELRKPTTE